jgi:hypothetical protein
MTMPSVNRFAACLCACAGFLSACGSSSSSGGSSVPYTGIRSEYPRGGRVLSSQNRRATSQNLLYVSSIDGNVYLYSYPQGKGAGTLTGLDRPQGECVDSTGDVFITSSYSGSSYASIISEYAHGGTSPIATLKDPGVAYNCSIDPNTDDLAVANGYDQSNPYNPGLGSVAIFADAKGSPKMYYSSIYSPGGGAGYDDNGNLYLSVGTTSSGREALLARIAKGSDAIREVTLDKKVYTDLEFVPSVQWDGQHMTISSVAKSVSHDRGDVYVYHLSIVGLEAKVISTTTLVAIQPNIHGGQSWIQGNVIAGINYHRGEGWVSVWSYPKGGRAIHTIRHIAPRGGGELRGVTISIAPSR